MKSAKRPNGDGSIRKKTRRNKDGSEYVYYEGRITLGFDMDGNQIQRTITAKTQRALVDKMQRAKNELQEASEAAVEAYGITLNEFSAEWLSLYLIHVKQSTINLYETRLNSYIRPTLGKMRLHDITYTHVQKLYNSLLNARDKSTPTLSPKTVKDIHGVLKPCLDCAVELGYISANPAERCKLPKVPKREMSVLDEDALPIFFKEIEGHVHENFYKLAVYTGLREGELLGLTWPCINFTRGTLTVKQQLQKDKRRGGEYAILPTKNDEIRVIRIPTSVVAILKDQREKERLKEESVGDVWAGRNLVFSNPIGDYLSYRTVYDCFKRVVKKIGYPTLRFHDLRHTYATICISIGDSPNVVQKNLGHKTPHLAMQIYEHVTAPMMDASANRMELFIQEKLI